MEKDSTQDFFMFCFVLMVLASLVQSRRCGETRGNEIGVKVAAEKAQGGEGR